MQLLLLAKGQYVAGYLIPLAAAVSLAYSASRFEHRPQILRRAARLFVTIVVSMTAIFLVLFLLSWKL